MRRGATVLTPEDVDLCLRLGFGVEDIRVNFGVGYRQIAELIPDRPDVRPHRRIAMSYAIRPRHLRIPGRAA